jgi:phosphatidylinositol glycan class V
VAHLLSVLVLFALGTIIFPSRSPPFALTAAFLHIFSPAGLFLSAPYAESPCALLSFSGILLFVKSIVGRKERPSIGKDLLVLLSGMTFGVATTFRSNGILNGLLLLEEAFGLLFSLRRGFRLTTIRRLVATGLGGLSVGAGFIVPQYIAWKEYCGQGEIDANFLRPWCHKSLPSVYSFVQDHYW